MDPREPVVAPRKEVELGLLAGPENPSVKKLIRYVSRCGPNGTSAFQTVASDARAPGAQIGCCECAGRPTVGMTMLSTSNVIATAKIPSLSAARSPRFCPEKW